MSSTNKTSHYNLSQYSASDKPTYLVDYNTDMSNIDTGIYNAQTTANSLEANIGTLSDLTTTAKSNTVAAINEVNGKAVDNTTAIGSLQTATATNTSNIGTMTNLSTTDKSSLVNAVNEVKSQVDLFKLVNYNTCTLSINSGTVSEGNVRCATNSDGSLFRLYGNFTVGANAWTNVTITISNTGLPTISEPYTIESAGYRQLIIDENNNLRTINLTINTNGSISISFGMESATVIRVMLFNGLYFNTNFGDTPSE